MIKALAPGSILQLMFLKRRLRDIPSGTFLEFGAGEGHISNLLLSLGWKGESVDLNQTSCDRNERYNDLFIKKGYFSVECIDVKEIQNKKYDLIISSMVIEHIPDKELFELFAKLKQLLATNGLIITLVPAGMKYWSIEDEIAGHIKRYERQDILALSSILNLNVQLISGLTFPISNLLLPISNRIIQKKESWKKKLSLEEKTIASSSRDIMGKTHFPSWLNIILNEISLYPLYILQRIFKNSKRNMVLYFELKQDS